MLLSLIAGLAGMLFAPLASWLAWPAKMLLTYMLDLSALFARIPHALVEHSLTVGGLIVLYCVILLVSAILGHKAAHHGTITDVNTSKL
jgi:hypothetical protein